MLPDCWASMGQKGVKATWPACYSSGGRGWVSPNSLLWFFWLHAGGSLAPWLLPPLTVVLNPQPLWLYICRKNLQAPTRIGKGRSLTLQGEGQGVASAHSWLFRQTLKSSWFCPHPQHILARARAHTHTQSLALPSTLPSVEGGAFLELFRPEDLVSLQPSSPYTLRYNPALQITGLAKKFVQIFPWDVTLYFTCLTC